MGGNERQPWRWMLGAVACVAVPACGARTSVDLVFSHDVVRDSGVSREASVDAPVDARLDSLGDTAAPDASRCGAPWVVFVLAPSATGESELYAIRADGSDAHPIPLPHAGPSFPWVSADGSLLVYTVGSGAALYLHRFADGSDQVLATPSGVVGGFAALAPNGEGLAYSTNAGLEYAPLSRAGAGAGRLLVASSPDGFLGDRPGFPTFAADGATIVFGTHTAIGSVHTDGTGVEALIRNPSDFVGVDNASLSPDQTQLVAGVACPVGVYGLRLYTYAALPADCATGALLTSFDPPGPSPFYPAWGPTGLIAYWNGSADILLVDASGGGGGGAAPRNLTQGVSAGLGQATMPAWAPACAPL